MKRFVSPHDLQAMCDAVGVTPGWVAYFAGIEEETLFAFARGEVALSANDRLAIMELLLAMDTIVPFDCGNPKRTASSPRIAWTQRARDALDVLRAEAMDELKETTTVN